MTRLRRFKNRPPAFTLIELLVVISIIAMLIAILLPALSAARQTANTMSGLSNQRQIGLTMVMYADDNRDLLPAGHNGSWPEGGRASWYSLLNPYVGGLGINVNTFWPGGEGHLSDVFRCPNAGMPQSGFSHYSANPILMQRRDWWGAFPDPEALPHGRMSYVQNPSEIISIMDGAQNPDHDNWTADPVAYMVDNGIGFQAPFWLKGMPNNLRNNPIQRGAWDDTAASAGDIRYRQANNEAANVLFVDGHAETRREGDIYKGNLVYRGFRPQ